MRFPAATTVKARALHGLFIVFWLGCVVVFGALAASGNPTLIAAGIGAIALAFLFRDPKISIPIIVVLSLPTGALISMIGPAAGKLPWLVSAMTFALWPVAIACMLQRRKVPAFVYLSLGFAAYAIVAAVAQRNALSEIVGGWKRYFQGYGVMFAMALFAVKQQDVKRLERIILGITFLQLPFAFYELVVLVPLRGGLEAGGEATDVVAGTFGANLVGGSANAEMAAFLLIIFAFSLSRWRGKLIKPRPFLAMTLLCLAPLTMGETKVVVLLLPIILCVLLRKDFMRDPIKNIPMMLAGLFLSFLFGYIYIAVMGNVMAGDLLADTVEYNVGNDGYGNDLLNRTTVLSFWWQHHSLEMPFQLFFGHGVGSAYLGPDHIFSGHVALQYPRYGISLTTASTLLWDVGVVGLGLHLALYGAAWLASERLWRQVAVPSVRADLLGIQAALAIFLVFTFYRDSTVNLIAFEVVVALVLGYLGWLIHMHGGAGTTTRARHG